MNQKQLRKLNEIVRIYGINPQIDMAIEEMSELTKALLKWRRSNDCEDKLREDIIDETADVSIMLEQIKIIFGSMEETEERMDFKINRQMEHIEANE